MNLRMVTGFILLAGAAAVLYFKGSEPRQQKLQDHITDAEAFVWKTTPFHNDLEAKIRLKGERELDRLASPGRREEPHDPDEFVDNGRHFSLQELLTVMAISVQSVPSFVPTLPYASVLAQGLFSVTPDAIRVGALQDGALGTYNFHDDRHHPYIVLSEAVPRLYEKGVPLILLVPILAHEIDHFLAYLQKEMPVRSQNEIEERAFKTMALHLFASGDALDREAVKAEREGADPEVQEYYRFLKRTRKAFWQGKLPQLVRELYGPNHGRRYDEPRGRQVVAH